MIREEIIKLLNYLRNKDAGQSQFEQVQADWENDDKNSPSFIKNKPFGYLGLAQNEPASIQNIPLKIIIQNDNKAFLYVIPGIEILVGECFLIPNGGHSENNTFVQHYSLQYDENDPSKYPAINEIVMYPDNFRYITVYKDITTNNWMLAANRQDYLGSGYQFTPPTFEQLDSNSFKFTYTTDVKLRVFMYRQIGITADLLDNTLLSRIEAIEEYIQNHP